MIRTDQQPRQLTRRDALIVFGAGALALSAACNTPEQRVPPPVRPPSIPTMDNPTLTRRTSELNVSIENYVQNKDSRLLDENPEETKRWIDAQNEWLKVLEPRSVNEGLIITRRFELLSDMLAFSQNPKIREAENIRRSQNFNMANRNLPIASPFTDHESIILQNGEIVRRIVIFNAKLLLEGNVETAVMEIVKHIGELEFTQGLNIQGPISSQARLTLENTMLQNPTTRKQMHAAGLKKEYEAYLFNRSMVRNGMPRGTSLQYLQDVSEYSKCRPDATCWQNYVDKTYSFQPAPTPLPTARRG